MHVKKLLPALVAVALGLSSLAPVHARDHHDRGRHGDKHFRGGPPGKAHGHYKKQRYDFGPRNYPRGAGPEHRFHRGDRLPPEYRGRHYVVNDWRGHHLNAPPRGYQWVQVGGDYVLAAIATGIIASLILNQ